MHYARITHAHIKLHIFFFLYSCFHVFRSQLHIFTFCSLYSVVCRMVSTVGSFLVLLFCCRFFSIFFSFLLFILFYSSTLYIIFVIAVRVCSFTLFSVFLAVLFGTSSKSIFYLARTQCPCVSFPFSTSTMAFHINYNFHLDINRTRYVQRSNTLAHIHIFSEHIETILVEELTSVACSHSVCDWTCTVQHRSNRTIPSGSSVTPFFRFIRFFGLIQRNSTKTVCNKNEIIVKNEKQSYYL